MLTPVTTNEPAPDLDVVVLGGGGHVGLPLSLVLADSGARVGIFDRDAAKLDRIGAGEMPFMETGADRAPRRGVLPTGRLELGTDPAMVARTDVVVVVVGTPVDEFLGPSMAPFEGSVDEIAAFVRPGALIVLRSTVYPGHHRLREGAVPRPRLRGRGGVLPGADRGGPCARGAQDAPPDRRRG